MNNSNKDNKFTKAGKSVLYTFVFLVIVGLLNDAGSAMIGLVAVLCITGGIVALALFFAKRLAASKASGANGPRGYTTHQNHQPKSYDPEVLRDRDSLRRLEQLDNFLANGIIDKKEYAALKAKYERRTGNE